MPKQSFKEMIAHARWDAFKRTCAYCVSRPAVTMDHVVAREWGGTNGMYNLLPCCIECNQSKGHQDLVTWMRRRGFVPSPELLAWMKTHQPLMIKRFLEPAKVTYRCKLVRTNA